RNEVRNCFILTKWYVNRLSQSEVKECLKSFILTKWYVNRARQNIFRIRNNRFILTKWYVNLYSLMLKYL
ncbi:hypothetical protein SIK47_18850, partial [Clostridioides difficile]|nr:hypothetical protein [Clostridioides difficile]